MPPASPHAVKKSVNVKQGSRQRASRASAARDRNREDVLTEKRGDHSEAVIDEKLEGHDTALDLQGTPRVVINAAEDVGRAQISTLREGLLAVERLQPATLTVAELLGTFDRYCSENLVLLKLVRKCDQAFGSPTSTICDAIVNCADEPAPRALKRPSSLMRLAEVATIANSFDGTTATEVWKIPQVRPRLMKALQRLTEVSDDPCPGRGGWSDLVTLVALTEKFLQEGRQPQTVKLHEAAELIAHLANNGHWVERTPKSEMTTKADHWVEAFIHGDDDLRRYLDPPYIWIDPVPANLAATIAAFPANGGHGLAAPPVIGLPSPGPGLFIPNLIRMANAADSEHLALFLRAHYPAAGGTRIMRFSVDGNGMRDTW